MKKYSILILLCLLSYCRGLHYEFVWDDTHFIVENQKLTHTSSIADFFMDPHTLSNESIYQQQIYRPLRTSLFAMLLKLGGGSTLPFHLFSLLLHLLCTCLVYALGNLFLKPADAGFIAALLFAVHPIHVEAIAWISALADPLYTVFYLTSLLLFISGVQRQQKWRCHLALWGGLPLALLAKESAITWPLLLGLWYFCFARTTLAKRESQRYLLTAIAIAIVYFIWRQSLLQQLAQTPVPFTTLLLNMALIPWKYLQYLQMFFWPFGLNAHHPPVAQMSLLGIKVLLAWLFWAAWLIWIYPQRQRQPLLLWLSGWFIITLLPVMNIIPITVDVAERFHYLPGIALFYAAGWGLASAVKRRRFLSHLITATLVVGLLSLTWQRLPVWQNRFSLAWDTAQKSPQLASAQWNLATAAYVKKDYAIAIRAYETFNRLVPGNYDAYVNLANAYAQRGNYAKAVQWGKRATHIKVDDYRGFANLSGYQLGNQQLSEALASISRAIELNPTAYQHYVQRGRIYLQLKNYKMAKTDLLKAESLGEDPYIYILLIRTAQMQHLPAEARHWQSLIEKKYPQHLNAPQQTPR